MGISYFLPLEQELRLLVALLSLLDVFQSLTCIVAMLLYLQFVPGYVYPRRLVSGL